MAEVCVCVSVWCAIVLMSTIAQDAVQDILNTGTARNLTINMVCVEIPPP